MTAMLKNQTVFPDSNQMSSVPTIRQLSVPGHFRNSGSISDKGMFNSQCHTDDTFILLAGEGRLGEDSISHHTQQEFIKVYFRLSGGKSKHVFNGFGELDCDRPQLVILAGPPEMLKIDLGLAGVYSAAINLLVLRDFFTSIMGLDMNALPNALRKIVSPREASFALHCMPLTPGMVFSARAALATTPCLGQLGKPYYQSKAIELMCLVINCMKLDEQRGTGKAQLPAQKVRRLYEVRELLSQQYGSQLTLDALAKSAGLGKTTLTSGFLQLFGMSVFDYIQQERMSRAHELLCIGEQTMVEIAEAVGYNHQSNFSAAFRNYFGCSPQNIFSK